MVLLQLYTQFRNTAENNSCAMLKINVKYLGGKYLFLTFGIIYTWKL